MVGIPYFDSGREKYDLAGRALIQPEYRWNLVSFWANGKHTG